MSKATKTRLDRLDKLGVLLKSDRRLTVKVLARELGVSSRTITRDIEILRTRGYPIDADRGRGGGVQLHRFWGVGRVRFDLSEAIDLLISIAVSEKMNSPLFLGKLNSVRNKVLASFSSDLKLKLQTLRSRIFVGFPATANIMSNFKPVAGSHTEHIHQAFLELKLLRINYSDARGRLSRRSVEPHHLFLHYPVWYLLAWDHLRNDVRHFRLDRIRHARIIDESFNLREFDSFDESIQAIVSAV